MNLFRNPEVQKTLIFFGIVTVAACVLAGVFGDEREVVLAAGVCAVFIFSHLLITRRRYRELAKMNEQIDKILHGEAEELWKNCEEGELSILHSQIEKMVNRLREQAAQLQEEKVFMADSLADISHQVKTPLTSIHLLLSFLNEETLTKERRLELTREISILLERIDWLIYALLKISRLDAGTVTMNHDVVRARELAVKSYEQIAVALDVRDIQWRCELEDNITFMGDLSWSMEALTNILKNCMEHTPAGGSIRVTGEENALYTELVITDTGKGIAKEDLPHIFERFYKGKNSDNQSIGIGLALARRIVAEQNGTIKADNVKSGGAVFIIRFYKSTV